VRPPESILFQALLPEGEAGVVPVQHFDLRSFFVAENEWGPPKGRQCHIVLHDDAEAVYGFAKVHRLTMQVDFYIFLALTNY
jgi:hypothetical protein